MAYLYLLFIAVTFVTFLVYAFFVSEYPRESEEVRRDSAPVVDVSVKEKCLHILFSDKENDFRKTIIATTCFHSSLSPIAFALFYIRDWCVVDTNSASPQKWVESIAFFCYVVAGMASFVIGRFANGEAAGKRKFMYFGTVITSLSFIFFLAAPWFPNESHRYYALMTAAAVGAVGVASFSGVEMALALDCLSNGDEVQERDVIPHFCKSFFL